MVEQEAVRRLYSELHHAWYEETYIEKERADLPLPSPGFWTREFWSLAARARRAQANAILDQLFPGIKTRSQAEIQADIDLLPEVRVTVTKRVSIPLEPLEGTRRLFIGLRLSSEEAEAMVEPDYGDHKTCTDLAALKSGEGSTFHVNFWRSVSQHHASEISTSESAMEDRMTGGSLDWTHTYANLSISWSTHDFLRSKLLEFQELDVDSPQRQAILSIDVPEAVYINSRELQTGNGASFSSISSGPFQPARFGLHFFLPPPWTKPDNAGGTDWPPRSFPLDYPTETFEIIETQDL